MKQAIIYTFLFLISSFSFSQEFETITENFDDNKLGWTVGEREKKSAVIKDGIFTYHNKEEEYMSGAFNRILINRDYDYSYEIKIKLTEGPINQGFGLALGFNDWDNYGTTVISANGYLKVEEEFFGKTYKMVKPFKVEGDIIKGMNEWNILKIAQVGDETKVYVNGKHVTEFPNYDFFGTVAGFVVQAGQKVEVDYIKITRKKDVIDPIANATLDDKLENLGSGINSKYKDLFPIISADGKTMYYALQGNPDMNKGKELLLDAVYSERNENGEWSKPKLLTGEINNEHANYVISMSPDENSALIGGTCWENDTLKYGIGYSIKRNGKWSKPQKIKFDKFVNYANLVEYHLSSDGMVLLSSIYPKGSYGINDICVSFLNDDGSFTEPKNLGPTINTYAKEISPYLAADGKTLYFSSYGHPGYGSCDVFVSKRLDDTWTNWSTPKNAGPVINSEDFDAFFKVDSKGEYAYLNSSKNSLGNEDIFRVKVGEGLKPEVLNLVSGKVYNAKTKELIEAAIEYEDLTNGKKMGVAFSTSENGFKISLPKGKNYGFRASSEGYISVSNNMDLTSIDKYTEHEIDLYLVPVESGQKLTLNNLFFETAKSTLQIESFPELNRLAKTMKADANLKVEIIGYTDSQGDPQNNLTLSENRAKAVKDYLVSKGVSASNIKTIGKGEKEPVASNKTPEGRKKNRRVELKIQ